MLELAYPWLLALLPAPLLAWWLLPPFRERRLAVRVPFFRQLADGIGLTAAPGAVVANRAWGQMLLAVLCWALIVFTLARPQWLEDPITKTESARDLLLAVDLSGSMDTTDFVDDAGNPLQRLKAVKQVLDGFITRRKGDRIALLFFGSGAYLQVPFTRDHETCRWLLDEARVRMAGPQTVIGDALGLAVKVFESSEAPEKVVVLLTDGNDTRSRVPPERAAEFAAEHGVTVHTIGMGDPETAGEGAMDMDALSAIAKVTGGKSFLAADREGLEAVYSQLDQLEPELLETLSYRPRRPLYHWSLGVFVGLFFLYHLFMGVTTAWRGRVGQ